MSLLNFALFQVFWFVAVLGAADGRIWLGPLALLALVAIHLRLVPAPERRRELAYLLAVGVAGAMLDTLLHHLDATAYPTSRDAWPFLLVPPWIASLWVGFATLPRFSLRWLSKRPLLAALLGGIGGPLTFYGGTRLGAVAIEESALWSLGLLAIEYAVATPLMLAFAGPWRTQQGSCSRESSSPPDGAQSHAPPVDIRERTSPSTGS